MAVVNISATAPPSRSKNVRFTTDPKAVAVAEAFDAIRKMQPILYAKIESALHDLLDPEMQHIKRVPPDKLQVSQGRVQIADDILGALDNCTEITSQAKMQRDTRAGNPQR